MKKFVPALVLGSFLLLTNPVQAESPADHGPQAMPPLLGHDQHQTMHPKSIMLGEQTVDGVKCKAMIKDVGAAMAKMGMQENHHFMVMFSNAATGAPIEQGTAAVKITDTKTGKVGEPIALMGMGNHFGADVALTNKGEYQFQVGTKLADGKTRQFRFSYTVN